MSEAMIAVDIGASGGRLIAGENRDGRLALEELHRFDNGAMMMNGHLAWDMEGIFQNILTGLKKAKAAGKTSVSIAVDTWAVDYVLLDKEGRTLDLPFCYRDGRTKGMEEALRAIIDEETLYARTGIQKQLFNTVYQLLADRLSGRLTNAVHLLMIPEYINYRLTGRMMNEYTNATTTGLVDALKRTWSMELISRCGLPNLLFGPLHQPGELVGRFKPEIAQEVGFDTEVVLAPTHDTAAAVMAAPLKRGGAYLSSGTWSLLGIETEAPILSEDARKRNMTNEGGAMNTYRFLKNIMGLWLIQRIKKETLLKASFCDFEQLARESGYRGVVDAEDAEDAEDERFLAPPSMVKAVNEALKERGFPPAATPGELASCVFHSLALGYKKAVGELEALSSGRIAALSIVGAAAAMNI